jgi:hypothetical protein
VVVTEIVMVVLSVVIDMVMTLMEVVMLKLVIEMIVTKMEVVVQGWLLMWW